MVNAAIGLEILFKSFHAEVDGSPGGIGEHYKVDRGLGHNLLRLFDAIPTEILEDFDLHIYREYFEGSTANLFVLARYPYEKQGIDGGSEAIVEIAEEIFDRVMREYKAGECNDPWIVAFPNI